MWPWFRWSAGHACRPDLRELGHSRCAGPPSPRRGTPGRAPLGYLNQRHIEDGHEVRTVTVDPERGPRLAWAFSAYATGEWSMDEIVSELNARGLTTKPGPNTPRGR